jgi:hypothetical protein
MVMRASAHSELKPVADAATATITIRRRRDALLGGFLLAMAGLWVAVPLKGLLLDPSATMPHPGVPGTIFPIVVGAALGMLAVSWIVRCQVLVIDQGLVKMTDRRLTGLRVWEESLARYRGVRLRHEQLPHRYGSRNCYIIEIWHPEPAKTVELERSKNPHLIERGAAVWARRLALPLCQVPDQRPARSQKRARDQIAEEARPADCFPQRSHRPRAG